MTTKSFNGLWPILPISVVDNFWVCTFCTIKRESTVWSIRVIRNWKGYLRVLVVVDVEVDNFVQIDKYDI